MSSQARAAVWLWARREGGQRWRTLVVLGLLAGMTAGLALAGAAGARRTNTAYERFREVALAPDATIFATQVGLGDADWDAVRALPEVEAAGAWAIPFGTAVELDGEYGGLLAPADVHAYRDVNRPLLVEGRLPDPNRTDEVLINGAAAEQHGDRIGDRVKIVTWTDSALAGSGEAPDGPSFEARIVGIGNSDMDFSFAPDEPLLFPSAAVLVQHPEVVRWTNLHVRLRPGTDLSEFRARAAAALGVPEVPVQFAAENTKRITHGTDLEAVGLLLFAASVAIAGVVLVGQALARAVYAAAEPVGALRALGLTRRELIIGLVLPVGLTASTATLSAIAVAVALSPRFPVGLARRLDPDLGFHFDAPVILPGAALVALLVLAGAALAAGWVASAREDRAERPARRSVIAQRLREAGSLPLAIGASLVLEPGHGRRALPSRPALASAVAGVLGVVGALGLVSGIDDALAEPERSGAVFDLILFPDEEQVDALVDGLLADSRIDTVSKVWRVPLDVGGAGVPVFALESVRGPAEFVTLSGRGPEAPDEIALGPATMKSLGVGVGDTVELGAAARVPMRVVGQTLLLQTVHAAFDQGAWVTPEALKPIIADLPAGEQEQAFPVPVATLHGELDEAIVADVGEQLGVYAEGAQIPQDVRLLRNVRALPEALAAFLVLLAIGAVGHVLVTTVRRRRHDLAVLRALGMRPRQAAACIAWQATTVGLIALVLGIPFGIILGRTAWAWIASVTPLVYVGPIAAGVVVLAAPATVGLANLLAALPARRAARLRAHEVLRTE